MLKKQTTTKTDLDTYKDNVTKRFSSLSVAEVSSIMKLYGTNELQVISKVLGPEVTATIGAELNDIMQKRKDNPAAAAAPIQSVKKRGLAARK